MAKSTRWYTRLADVPGVNYVGNPSIDRTKLPGHDLKPEIDRSGFSYGDRHFLSWPYRDGTSSASPAANYRSGQLDKPTAKAIIRQLEETLELPGIASDYHFAILNAVEALWKFRFDSPQVFGEIERFCWLDIKLIQADPDAASMLRDGKIEYNSIPAFRYLKDFRATEGDLRSAWEIELLARQYGQFPDQALEEAHKILKEEDVA